MKGARGKEKRLLLNRLILKTWEQCKSIRRAKKICSMETPRGDDLINCKHVSRFSGDNGGKQCRKRARKGCFPVYVGMEKQKFVIKAEYANHPLFLELLEEAESEFGFNCNGPLVLPCGVDLFCEVLLAIDGGCGGVEDVVPRQLGCGFVKSYVGYRLLKTPKKMIAIEVGKQNIQEM